MRAEGAAGAGAGLGLACGFALWALLVPLAGVSYHAAETGLGADPARRAAAEAGRLWLGFALAGGTIGALAGLPAASRPAAGRALVRAAAGAAGLYALALRGAWGGPDVAALPAAATAAPLALALAAAAVLLASGRRAPAAGGAGLAALHLCLSLGAAHLAVQLPYYVGLRGSVARGLAELGGYLAGLP